jgi:hypothetical protein
MYGLSPSDAEQLARVVLYDIQSHRRNRFNEIRAEAVQIANKLLEDRPWLRQAPRLLEQAKAGLAVLGGRVPWDSVAAAKKEFARLDDVLYLLENEAVGLEAKLAAITQLTEEPARDEANDLRRLLLEQFRIEQELELAAIRAREEAARERVELARRYVAEHAALREAQRDFEELSRTVPPLERKYEALLYDLTNPSQELRPLKLKANEIVIRPVK